MREIQIYPTRRAESNKAINDRSVIAAKNSLELALVEFALSKKLLELAIAMRDRNRLAAAERRIEIAEENLAKAKRLHADSIMNSRIIKNPDKTRIIHQFIKAVGISVENEKKAIPRPPIRHEQVVGAVTTKEQIRNIILKRRKIDESKLPYATGQRLIEIINATAEKISLDLSTTNAFERRNGKPRTVFTEKDIIVIYPKVMKSIANVKRNGGMFVRSKDGFYSGYPVGLSQIIRINPEDTIPFSKIKIDTLREIAERRVGTSGLKTKQDLINALKIVGYEYGVPESVVDAVERRVRSRR